MLAGEIALVRGPSTRGEFLWSLPHPEGRQVAVVKDFVGEEPNPEAD